ncbi:Rox3 mediator complex subunit-domain-containing protein [Peziza echinospora]|nr:Rox3 mediator complex subunit-domain-containing protein [Peziza echinospora]
MTTIISHHQYPLDQPTPQSPSNYYMSRDHATTKSSAMSEKSQSYNSMASSPPINSSFASSRHSQSSANTMPTPTSAAGTVPPTTAHDLDDDMMDVSRDFGVKSGKRRRSMSAEDQHDIYRNHDRNTGTKRSRSVEFVDSNEQMTEAPAPAPAVVPTLQSILAQADVHPLHLMCHLTYPILHPRPTVNVLPLYNLSSIADSVARSDPVTGAKKKLRKSYKGKILDLPGKNEIPKARPPPTEAEIAEGNVSNKGRPMSLLEMLDWPEEEWHAQKVAGKELNTPIPFDQLRRACTMTTGPIPGFDPSILGLEEKKALLTAPKSAQTQAAVAATPQFPNGSTPSGNISSASVSPAVHMDSSRPQRNSRKKRRKYDDNSFEGYGEGYEDEEAEDYGDDSKKKRKRKKVE